MKEIKDISIDISYCNKDTIEVDWSANIGFGQLSIFRRSGDWYADTETLCNNEDKKFIKQVFDKWVDGMKIVG